MLWAWDQTPKLNPHGIQKPPQTLHWNQT